MHREHYRSIFLILILAMLAIAAQAQQLQPAAQPKATAAATHRPSDSLNEALPQWLKFNGEYRARLEGIDGGGFKANADDAYTLSRVRLNLAVTPASWLRGVVQAQ